ncbi:aldo/keto reductase [Lentzea alba]|uniref:aldo/keto reductase n=1 Tax=Lentzea alba TaxID=2714351 RepID=UPI0039BFD5CC
MAGHSGVNLIDTADVYRKGDSERVIGLAIAGTARRGRPGFLAAKVMGPARLMISQQFAHLTELFALLQPRERPHAPSILRSPSAR